MCNHHCRSGVFGILLTTLLGFFPALTRSKASYNSPDAVYAWYVNFSPSMLMIWKSCVFRALRCIHASFETSYIFGPLTDTTYIVPVFTSFAAAPDGTLLTRPRP